MTDDIVTRLREWQNEFDLHWTLPDEAADEIERLEKELEIYKDLYASEAVNNVEKRYGTR